MDILTQSRHLLARAELSATDKWEAARGTSKPSPGIAWLWYILGGVIAAFVGAMAVYMIVRSMRQRRKAWAEFTSQAQSRGLSPEGLDLLKRIVKQCRLKSPATIFTLASAFDQGASDYLESNGFAALSDQAQNEVLDLLDSMRKKIDFASQGGGGAGGRSGSRGIPEGTHLTVFRKGGAEEFEAVVASTNAVDMAIEPHHPVYCKGGERIEARFAADGELLEFQTTVVHTRNGNIVLDHTDNTYPAGRRRYRRIAIERPAWIAPMPLKPAGSEQRAAYEDALLVEMGGPGIKLECPLELDVHDRVMVAVALVGGKITHAAGKIIRVCTTSEGMPRYALELIGLSEEETDRLFQEISQDQPPAGAGGGAADTPADDTAEAPAPREAEGLHVGS